MILPAVRPIWGRMRLGGPCRIMAHGNSWFGFSIQKFWNFRFEISGVPTLVEQNELIAVIMIHFFTRKERKRLLNGHFFKKRNAKDLQNRKQSTVQV